MEIFDTEKHPHRRYNPLKGSWILVSPHRSKRPWQGQEEELRKKPELRYDENCYLCPGNLRANGVKNPHYKDCYVFDNDFSAILPQQTLMQDKTGSPLFKAVPERGICRVVCFSPQHNLTLPKMTTDAIKNVIRQWQLQYRELGSKSFINCVLIFENKGIIMGCSNPHPHGQIWAQTSIPVEVATTQYHLKQYYDNNRRSLLKDYLEEELKRKQRLVTENEHFAAVVPFWALWPYEILLISKRHFGRITDMSEEETIAYADILKTVTVKYDNLFKTSFPYSSGIHQAPTDGEPHPEWHFHMHFYPPLLRSATVKKFMVGYELLGEAQRDITPEKSAQLLRELPDRHYGQSPGI